ncbi:hypothetical protein [Glycocaulis sp.]
MSVDSDPPARPYAGSRARHLQRHLYRRENFKTNRDTAMAEWRQLAA